MQQPTTSAWIWLTNRLKELLGEQEFRKLMTEFNALRRQDGLYAQARRRTKAWERRGDERSRAWLVERGFPVPERRT